MGVKHGMWVALFFLRSQQRETKVMGSLLALNAVIIGIQVDAWAVFSTSFFFGGPKGSQGQAAGLGSDGSDGVRIWCPMKRVRTSDLGEFGAEIPSEKTSKESTGWILIQLRFPSLNGNSRYLK